MSCGTRVTPKEGTKVRCGEGGGGAGNVIVGALTDFLKRCRRRGPHTGLACITGLSLSEAHLQANPDLPMHRHSRWTASPVPWSSPHGTT